MNIQFKYIFYKFSRLDEAEYKPVDIHEGLNSALFILQNSISYALKNRPEIQIFKEYGDFPLVNCYPGQLNQVFLKTMTSLISI